MTSALSPIAARLWELEAAISDALTGGRALEAARLDVERDLCEEARSCVWACLMDPELLGRTADGLATEAVGQLCEMQERFREELPAGLEALVAAEVRWEQAAGGGR